MAPQPTRGGPRQRFQPTPRGVNMIVWSLDNRFVLAAIMGRFLLISFDDGVAFSFLFSFCFYSVHLEKSFVIKSVLLLICYCFFL